jgi:transcriptional regulator with GAF, ATPase, and Fis domain
MHSNTPLFKTPLEAGESFLFIVDAHTGNVVATNQRVASETGHATEQLVGLPIDSLLEPRGSSPGTAGAGAADSRAAWLKRKDAQPLSVSVTTIEFAASELGYTLVIAQADQDAKQAPQEAVAERDDFPTIVGQSPKIREVCRRIGSLAKSDVTVLIQGESGTGKEIVANAVHAHSRRCRGPLVKVNCAALSEALLESELFGHVRGAFTGAIRDRHGRFKQADQGTLFLDEIGSMSLPGQAKLLRALQEQEFEPVGSSATVRVDARVIAATNADLVAAVRAGTFREDLYYRLNVFPIRLPPLRERAQDIPLLTAHFLRRCASVLGKSVPTLALSTSRLLAEYGWPGNVRELQNAVEHAVIIAESSIILPTNLPLNLVQLAQRGAESAEEPYLRSRLNEFEKQMLLEALARAGGVKKRAAELLGVDARNLPYLLRKHQLLEARTLRKS